MFERTIWINYCWPKYINFHRSFGNCGGQSTSSIKSLYIYPSTPIVCWNIIVWSTMEIVWSGVLCSEHEKVPGKNKAEEMRQKQIIKSLIFNPTCCNTPKVCQLMSTINQARILSSQGHRADTPLNLHKLCSKKDCSLSSKRLDHLLVANPGICFDSKTLSKDPWFIMLLPKTQPVHVT